jgi:hypothetical protein
MVALPAILTRPGFVVSTSALFGAESSLAKVQFAATSTAAKTNSRFFIRALSGEYVYGTIVHSNMLLDAG